MRPNIYESNTKEATKILMHLYKKKKMKLANMWRMNGLRKEPDLVNESST